MTRGKMGRISLLIWLLIGWILWRLRVSDFVDELVKLVRDEGVRVKVFAVMDTVRGECDEDLCVVDERVLAVQGLDQKVRGPFEDALTS